MWKRIKIKLQCLHLISKLRTFCHHFLKKRRATRSIEDILEIHTKLPMTPVKHSSSEETHQLGPKMETISSSPSSTQHSAPIIMKSMEVRRNGEISCQDDPSDQTSASILQSSGGQKMMRNGKTCEVTSGMTPAELNEPDSRGNKIKRRLAEGLLSISVIGLKVASIFILPFFSVFSKCTEDEIHI